MAHWCMNTTIMSTDGSSRAARRVRSSHRVCRFGVPLPKSGTAELSAATSLEVAGVAVVVGDRAVGDLRAGGGGLGRGVRRGVQVGGRAVLVDDVVGVEGDELHRADLEAVEVPAQAVAVPVGHAVVGQQEPAQVVAVAVGAVPVVARRALGRDPARRLPGPPGVVADAELGLVVAQRGHPRAVGRRARDVDAEVPPHARRVQHVQVGVAQVAVEQVEQRGAAAVAGVLDGAHRVEGVVAGLVPDVARGVQVPGRGGQVAVAGEAEGGPAAGRGLERGAGRGRRVRPVADLVVVPRAGLQAGELHVVEVRGLAVQPVGEADRGGPAGSAGRRRAAAARAPGPSSRGGRR